MREIKVGDRCVIVGNNSRHNITIGNVVTVTSINREEYNVKEYNQYFRKNDLEIWFPNNEYLSKYLEYLKSKTLEIETKIEYLNQTDSDIVIDSEFEKYMVSEIINSEIENTEKISKINTLRNELIEPLPFVERPKKEIVSEEEEIEEMEMESDVEDAYDSYQG